MRVATSFSRLREYAECPLRYRYLEVDGQREPSVPVDWSQAPAAIAPPPAPVMLTDRRLGFAIHRALLTWQRGVDAGGPVDAGSLETMVQAQAAANHLAGAQVDRAIQKLRPHLASYAAGPLPRLRTLGLEKPAVLRLEARSLEVEIAIRADRVCEMGEGIAIIDFKTVHPHRAQAAADAWQLRTYALARDELAPGHGGHVTLLLVDIGRPTVEVDASAEALATARAALEHAARSIAHQRFAVDPGHADRPCWRCGFRLACPSSLAPRAVPPRSIAGP